MKRQLDSGVDVEKTGKRGHLWCGPADLIGILSVPSHLPSPPDAPSSLSQSPISATPVQLVLLLHPLSALRPPFQIDVPLHPSNIKSCFNRIPIYRDLRIPLPHSHNSPPPASIPLPRCPVRSLHNLSEIVTSSSPRPHIPFLVALSLGFHSGGGGGGSVDVVSVGSVTLEGTSADAVRALKKFVVCRVFTEI
ncbi:hypothetical protein Tco_0172901 [Tanacetum coccineum]